MRVTVVSPHLDDAVLSVGGTIHDLVARGAAVTVVTVFAGDPDAGTPSSYWDAGRAPTQGAAVSARRREEEAATAALGVTAIALPWPDGGYAGLRDPAAIWDQLAAHVEDADVTLLPGWPLTHADHRYTTLVVLDRVTADRSLVFYAERPYASEPVTLLKSALRGRTPPILRHGYGAPIEWRRARLGGPALDAQRRAVQCYHGELENLGWRGRWDATYRRLSGEWLGYGQRARLPADLPLAASIR